MKNKDHITILAYFVASIAAFSGIGQTGATPTQVPLVNGWGGVNCTLRPINNAFDCSIFATGVTCTVTDNGANPITTNAYDSKTNCELQSTIGLLKRIQ